MKKADRVMHNIDLGDPEKDIYLKKEKDRIAFSCSKNIRIEVIVDKSISKIIEKKVNLISLNLNDCYYFQMKNKIFITKSRDYLITIIPSNISSQDIISNLRPCSR
jgi:hypothetical protein